MQLNAIPSTVDTLPHVREIYSQVEQMPEYPGGNEQLWRYIIANIKYPTAARDGHVQGQALVSFVIEKDGSMSNLKLLRNPGSGTGEEALRIIRKMADEIIWQAGMQRGKTVAVNYKLPINFKLDDNFVIPEEEVINKTIKGSLVYQNGYWAQVDTLITYYPERFEEEIQIIRTELTPSRSSNSKRINTPKSLKNTIDLTIL